VSSRLGLGLATKWKDDTEMITLFACKSIYQSNDYTFKKYVLINWTELLSWVDRILPKKHII
jgi:hypothetical protein